MKADYRDIAAEAVRPWNSVDAVFTASPTTAHGYHHKITDKEQMEIEACMNCPFVRCGGATYICKKYREEYVKRLSA